MGEADKREGVLYISPPPVGPTRQAAASSSELRHRGVVWVAVEEIDSRGDDVQCSAGNRILQRQGQGQGPRTRTGSGSGSGLRLRPGKLLLWPRKRRINLLIIWQLFSKEGSTNGGRWIEIAGRLTSKSAGSKLKGACTVLLPRLQHILHIKKELNLRSNQIYAYEEAVCIRRI
jgi:hypothetical protein